MGQDTGAGDRSNDDISVDEVERIGEAYLAALPRQRRLRNFRRYSTTAPSVVSDPIGALAHSQIGRAFLISGDAAKAKTAYLEFLALWKDADRNIPILKQAQAEYAGLH